MDHPEIPNPISLQIERAEILTDFLNEVLIDLVLPDSDADIEDDTWEPPPPLSVADLLDALASAGLKLVPDDAGDASMAYLTRLRQPASDAAGNN